MKKNQKPKLINYLQTFLDFSKCRKTFADLLMVFSVICFQSIYFINPKMLNSAILNNAANTTESGSNIVYR